MSEHSRRVKNPLLTAAGQGFPFEEYASNALLMPVTPGIPALLPDDNPKEGSADEEPTAGALSQSEPSSDIGSPEIHSKEGQPPQQRRQGYFTSILSTLPNLSLSTITGDVPAAVVAPSQHPAVRLGDSSVRGLAQNPHGPSPKSCESLVAANLHQTNTGHCYQRSGDIGLGAPSTCSPPPRPPPTAATLPLSGGPGAYRLGNPRRVKYAPPPDLTSRTPNESPAPTALGFLPPAQYRSPVPGALDFSTPSVTFQPDSTGHTPSGFVPSSDLYSGQISSLQRSHATSSNFSARSVPDSQQQQPPPPPINTEGSSHTREPTNQYNRPISGWPGPPDSLPSAPRAIPFSFPETATPQNTPANAPFAGFVSSYTAVPLAPSISSRHANGRAAARSTSSPEPVKFSEGLTFDVPSSVFENSNVGLIPDTIIEPGISLSQDTPLASVTVEDKSFTLISAAQVTAKLEHLRAEREEGSSAVKAVIERSSVFDEEPKPADYIRQQESLATSSDSEGQIQKDEVSDELTEIDLNANDSFPSAPLTQVTCAASQILTGIDSTLGFESKSFARTGSGLSITTETSILLNSSSIADSSARNQAAYRVTSPTNSFIDANQKRKSGMNYFPAASETLSAFYTTKPSQVPSQQTPTSSVIAHPPTAALNASLSLLTSVANLERIPSRPSAPPVPTFYNPGGFSSISSAPLYSVFTPQISTSGPTVSDSSSSATGSSPPNCLIPEVPITTTMPELFGTATSSPPQIAVNPGHGRSNSEMVPPSLQSLAAGPLDHRSQYRPVYHHWFYRKEVEAKVLWLPFSMQDSLNLEDVHNSSEISPETTVATDGGRYDVNILRRTRSPVYWAGNPTEVRRASWFHKGSTESRYIPYEEAISARLEEEYKQACITENWSRRIDLSNGEYIIFHSTSIQVHYVPATSPELVAAWGNSAGSETGTYLQGATSRPKVVKRGVDEFNIDEGEPEKVDHLLFIVHGIGSVCDLKFRTVEEVVDEFRSISLQLVQSHYRTASMHGVVNRIEVLPISWHTTLHSEDTGIDKKLQAITLDSIPKLRHFTNDTLLDILFYTSPIYCQTIMQTVGNEMNKLYSIFKGRNPNFGGSIYVGGHSLGSLIVFDLLCHQKPPADDSIDETDPTLLNPERKPDDDAIAPMKTSVPSVLKRRLSKKVSYVMGAAGTGQPFINYPQLTFHPQAFFALGSPIGMFVTVRGIDTLGDDFVLPTCPAFFNIFHPFDPVAYRVESLINPEAHKYRPMLIPHHKGRKRMHLELKETMVRVGADLKQKLMDSVRSTWNSVYQMAMFHRPDNQSLEQEIEKVVQEQMQKSPSVHEQPNADDGGAHFRVGNLNGGRRIDYVLQEAPFEYINEYIFALTSHVCYWESEDTMLMILKEIYGTNGVQADAQLPPRTMAMERVSPSPSVLSMSEISMSRSSVASNPSRRNATTPMDGSQPVGPPPTSGFVRNS